MEFDVQEGVTGQRLAQQLKDQGLLHSTIPFRFWMRLLGVDSKIQIGRYKFAVGRSAFWIVDDIGHGRILKSKLIIPEGFASWQVADRLEVLKICNPDDFKRVVAQEGLEGYLMPATYEIGQGLPASNVARMIKANFDLKWTPEFEERAKEWGWTKKEVVTFASIVEREVRVRDELPMVSAVYHNRLKKRMKLQADPTVQYAMGYWARRLTYDDYYKVQSPYNTYLVYGLPPGAICNPGLDSIRAALWPADSDALYFVATPDGHSTFSTSYREHTNNVNRRNRRNKK